VATDEELRQVVIEACDWLEHQSFTATVQDGSEYTDLERHYLIGWRDGYSRACAMLRSSVTSTDDVPDAVEIVDGVIVREIESA
jgi:hypothetical protein